MGFVGGVVFSLLMLMWPGIEAPGAMAPVALFGPNVGTTAGAAIGFSIVVSAVGAVFVHGVWSDHRSTFQAVDAALVAAGFGES